MIKNVIFEIDGTLMNIEHRRKFVSGDKKNWKLFNEHIQFDTPNKIVFNMLDIFINDVKLGLKNIYFVSGRKEKYRDITIKQICKYSCIDKIEIEDINLYMRDNKDFREDLFQDEINSVLQKRRKEYEEERKKELQEETSEIHSDIVNGYDCDGTPVDIYEN